MSTIRNNVLFIAVIFALGFLTGLFLHLPDFVWAKFWDLGIYGVLEIISMFIIAYYVGHKLSVLSRKDEKKSEFYSRIFNGVIERMDDLKKYVYDNKDENIYDYADIVLPKLKAISMQIGYGIRRCNDKIGINDSKQALISAYLSFKKAVTDDSVAKEDVKTRMIKLEESYSRLKYTIFDLLMLIHS